MSDTSGNIYFDSALPEESVEEFSPLAKTGSIEGIEANIARAYMQSPLYNLTYGAEYGYAKYLKKSKFLTNDEWKQTINYRSGLNFPEGVYESQAEVAAQNYDSKQRVDSIIQSMPNGFVSGLKSFTGQSIGFVLDPLNTAAAIMAPELIGTKMAPLLEATTEAANMNIHAARFATGAIEGIAAMAPQEGIELLTADLKQEEHTIAEAALSLGLAGGIGGVSHAIVGHLIDRHYNRLANQTATSQLMEGKKVNVEPLIKQGVHERAKTINEDSASGAGVDVETIQKSIAEKKQELLSKLRESNKNIDSLKLDPETVEVKLNDVNKSLDHISSIRNEVENSINELNKSITKKIPKNEISSYKLKLKGLGKKLERDVREREKINKILSDHKEALSAEKSIKKLTSRQKKLLSAENNLDSMKSVLESKLANNKLYDRDKINALDAFRKKFDVISNKLAKADINLSNVLPPESIQKESFIKDAENIRDDIYRMIEENDSIGNFMSQEHSPVTKEEIVKAVDELNSPESTSGIDMDLVRDYQEHIDELPENYIDSELYEKEQAEAIETIDSEKFNAELREEYHKAIEEEAKVNAARLKAIQFAEDCLGD